MPSANINRHHRVKVKKNSPCTYSEDILWNFAEGKVLLEKYY